MTFRPDMPLLEARLWLAQARLGRQDQPCPCCSGMQAPAVPINVAGVVEEAIARADRGMDPGWRERALQALYAVACTRPEFTSEDLWDVLDRPREPSAMGPILRRGITSGWCMWTGSVRPSSRPTQHRDVKIYRSLLFNSNID